MLHRLLQTLCTPPCTQSIEATCAEAYLLGEAYTLAAVTPLEASTNYRETLRQRLCDTYRTLTQTHPTTPRQHILTLLARHYIITGALECAPTPWRDATERDIITYIDAHLPSHATPARRDTHLLMHLMQNALYGVYDESDPWQRYLTQQFDQWIADLTPGGIWSGVGESEAMERLALLNKQRYMQRTHRYDAALHHITTHYLTALTLPNASQPQPQHVIERLALTYDTLHTLPAPHPYTEHSATLIHFFAEQYPLQTPGTLAHHLCSLYPRLHTLRQHARALQMVALV